MLFEHSIVNKGCTFVISQIWSSLSQSTITGVNLEREGWGGEGRLLCSKRYNNNIYYRLLYCWKQNSIYKEVSQRWTSCIVLLIHTTKGWVLICEVFSPFLKLGSFIELGYLADRAVGLASCWYHEAARCLNGEATCSTSRVATPELPQVWWNDWMSVELYLINGNLDMWAKNNC